MRKLIPLLALLFPAIGWGQVCTQSGQTLTAGSVNQVDVQQCINMLSGMSGTVTIQLPNGTAGWTSQLTGTIPAAVTNLTVQGNTTVNCTGTAGTSSYACAVTDNSVIQDNASSQFGLWQFFLSSASNTVFRLTGVTIQGGSGLVKGQGWFLTYAQGSGAQVRIDHNHFNDNTYTGGTIGSFAGTINGCTTGVIDHNVFDQGSGSSVEQGFMMKNTCNDSTVGGTYGDGSWAAASGWGSANFMFYENNVINGGMIGDCIEGGTFVVRYNNFNAGSTASSWIHQHGTAQNGGRLRSCRAYEGYQNYFNIGTSTISTMFGLAGSTALIWGNTMSATAGHFIGVGDERNDGQHPQTATPNGWGTCGSSTTGSGGITSAWDGNSPGTTGYPCLDGIGRGQGQLLNSQNFPNAQNTATSSISWPHEDLEPVYAWMNTTNGTPPITTGTMTAIAANRDYYIDNPSFNGTNGGTGFGTHAQRLALVGCTAGPGGTYGTSPTGSYGVAFWETDTNTLFICTSPNIWTSVYQPYTYPHPLTGGGVTNFTLTVTATNGTVSGTNCTSGTYTSGTVIGPCTTTPNAGFNFTGWSGTGNFAFASGTGTIPATALTQNSTLTSTSAAVPPCANPTENAPFGGGGTGPAGAYLFPPNTFPFTITMNSPTSGCVMHYKSTTDGSTPAAAACTDPAYPVGGFPINAFETFTLSIIACQTGFTNSAVVGDQWITANGQVLPPSFTPPPNTYNSSQSVVIASATPAAQIYYTTDGSTPTRSSTLYSGAITISATTTLKAFAVANGLVDSTVTTGVYTINSTVTLLPPTFSPAGGSFAGTQSVTISAPLPSIVISGTEGSNGNSSTGAVPARNAYTNCATSCSAGVWQPVNSGAVSNGELACTTAAQSSGVTNGCTARSVVSATITGTGTTPLSNGNGQGGVNSATSVTATYAGANASGCLVGTNFSSVYQPGLTLLGNVANAHTVYGAQTGTPPNTSMLAPTKWTFAGDAATYYARETCQKISITTVTGEHLEWDTDHNNSVKDLFDFGVHYNWTDNKLYYAGHGQSWRAMNIVESNGTVHTTQSWPGTHWIYTQIYEHRTNACTSSSPSNCMFWDYMCYQDYTAGTPRICGNLVDAVSGLTPGAIPVNEPSFAANFFGAQHQIDINQASGTVLATVDFDNLIGYNLSGAATICYTTDGSTPTSSPAGTCSHGTTYSGPISVSSTTTINAIATSAGFNDSPVTAATYTINGALAAPTASPVAGSYGPTQNVTLSGPAGATICYTTNGATPTATVAGTCDQSTFSGPIPVSTSLTIKAISTQTTFTNSSVASFAYTINGAASTPTFSPVAGTYSGTQSVTISSLTGGSTICYTVDGTTPSGNGAGSCIHGTVYSGPVSVAVTLTLQAIATKATFSDSTIGSAFYTITPVIPPAQVTISGKAVISGKGGPQ